MYEINPCPFCGSTCVPIDEITWHVECLDCCYCSPGHDEDGAAYYDKEKAISAHNRMAAKDERIAELEQALRDIIRHQRNVVGDMAKHSTATQIAQNALREGGEE